MYATYNITNDKIKFYPERRLTDEEYKQSRVWKFVFWHGSKCFVAKWSTGAEDFVKSFGVEIEEDDTPDDVDARVERFEAYAENAEMEAQAAFERSIEGTTERRRRLSEGVANRQFEVAEYWNQRIAGAIRHAAHAERPDVIARRIKEIEADLRRWQRETDIKTAKSINPYNFLVYDQATGKKRVDVDAMTAAQAPHKAEAERNIEHINMRLSFERALYAASGGMAADNKPLEIGGAVNVGNRWLKILKINKTTIRVEDPKAYWLKDRGVMMDKTDVRDVMSASEYAEYANPQTETTT